MDLYLRFSFPIFFILAIDETSGKTGPFFTIIENLGCTFLYKSRELAELFVEDAKPADPDLTLEVCGVNNDGELIDLLRKLPAACSHVVWESAPNPQKVMIISVEDMLKTIA